MATLIVFGCWFALLVSVVTYLCSWPQPASWKQVLRVDGTVLAAFVGIFVLGCGWHLRRDTADEALGETRALWPLLVPFWASVLAVPWFFGAIVVRYFLFRCAKSSTPVAHSSTE